MRSRVMSRPDPTRDRLRSLRARIKSRQAEADRHEYANPLAAARIETEIRKLEAEQRAIGG